MATMISVAQMTRKMWLDDLVKAGCIHQDTADAYLAKLEAEDRWASLTHPEWCDCGRCVIFT